jgi:membrane protein YdbS with pleckstrin-like domain
MKCPECSREIAADATFCPYCGDRLSDGRQAVASSTDDSNAGSASDRFRASANRGAGKQPPEAELWSDSYSPKALIGPFVAITLLVLISLVAVLFYWNTGLGWLSLGIGSVLLYGGLALNLAYQRLSLRYRLTTYRFFHERGLLSRVIDRIEVIDIDDVTVQQGVIERMLGVGTIAIQSSDRTHPLLRLPGIDNVKQIADLIDNTRRAERQRRGIHIESI